MNVKAKILGGVAALTGLASSVSAAYTPTYTSVDIAPGIIDLIVNIVVGMVPQADDIGSAIALTVSVGLFLGLLGLLFMKIKSVIKQGKAIK